MLFPSCVVRRHAHEFPDNSMELGALNQYGTLNDVSVMIHHFSRGQTPEIPSKNN